MTRTLGIRTMDGYDTADYQPHFVWPFSHASGDELACYKGTEGRSFKAHWFDWNRVVTAQLGFRYRGIYAWITPGVDIATQLAWFESVVGDLQLGEFIQLDEEQNPLSLDECVLACELFSQRYPGRVCHYGGAFFGGYGHVHPRLRKWPWWMAWYGRQTLPSVAFPPTLWQWGGSDVVGFGSVDSNQIIDRAQLETLCGYVHPDPVHTGGTDVIMFVQLDESHTGVERDAVWLSNNTASLTWMESQQSFEEHCYKLGWAFPPEIHQCATKSDLLQWGVPISAPPGWTW